MPHPKAVVITLSALQKQLLEQIAHRTTNAYRLVRRAQLILLDAEGFSNTAIGRNWIWSAPASGCGDSAGRSPNCA